MTLNIVYLWNTHVQRERIGTLSIDELKALWDRYDGVNEPDGFWGEEIHRELNRRGEGRYCAV